MSLKASKQAYTFNIIENGESSNEIPINISNTSFGDIEKMVFLPAPFCFNQDGEASELHSGTFDFNNTLKNNYNHDIVDSIYSSKQKAVYQLTRYTGEYGYKLTKINIGDTSYTQGDYWSVAIVNSSSYTFPNAFETKRALVLSECENFIFCLYNYTWGSRIEVAVNIYDISENTPVYHSMPYTDFEDAYTDYYGIDLIVPNNRINNDGTFTNNVFVHTHINDGGTITSKLEYGTPTVQREDLAVKLEQVIGEKRGGLNVFYGVPENPYSSGYASLCINQHDLSGDWGAIVKQTHSYKSTTNADLSIAKAGNYIFTKISSNIIRGLRSGCYMNPTVNFEFDDFGDKSGTGHTYVLGDVFELEVEFSFQKTPAYGQKILSILTGESGLELKYKDTDFKLQLVNDGTVVMETTSASTPTEFSIYKIHIKKDINGDTTFEINDTELPLAINLDFSYDYEVYEGYADLAYYNIVVDRLDGTRKPFDFSNIGDPFDGVGEGALVGTFVQKINTLDYELLSCESSSGNLEYEPISDSLYNPTTKGFEFFNNVTEEELTQDIVDIDYSVISGGHTFHEHQICIDKYHSQLFIYSEKDSEQYISIVHSKTGAFYTKDNLFWFKFKPTTVGEFEDIISYGSSAPSLVLTRVYGISIAAVSEDPEEYGVVRLGVGHRDFQKTGVISESVTIYTKKNDGTGDHIYNPDTGEFISDSNGDYLSSGAIMQNLQSQAEDFEAYFDTVNILFEPKRFDDTITDTNIKLFIKAAVSMARIEISYTSDGNYSFDSNKEYGELGEDIETADFDNSPVYYIGTKQVEIKEVITDQREARSIKLRVFARMVDDDDVTPRIDDFKVFSINILSEGLITIDGGTDA